MSILDKLTSRDKKRVLDARIAEYDNLIKEYKLLNKNMRTRICEMDAIIRQSQENIKRHN